VVQEGEASVALGQRNAIVAGLKAAGFAYAQAPIITYVIPTGPSFGRLEVNDSIVAIDGEEVHTAVDVSLALAKHAVGDKVNVTVKGSNGTERAVTISTQAGNAAENTAKLGISFEDNYTFDPVITFNLGMHSSPTGGGLLLSLGIYELLGGEDLLAGRLVAASGTVDASGTVSSVAGITQKLISAQRDGADVFLLPLSSCGNTPTWMGKMRVVVVTDLAGAIDSLRRLRNDPQAEVPHC
jgi:PDZ domain-containing protein